MSLTTKGEELIETIRDFLSMHWPPGYSADDVDEEYRLLDQAAEALIGKENKGLESARESDDRLCGAPEEPSAGKYKALPLDARFAPTPEVNEFLAGVVGVVEAHRFEQHSLWKEAHGEFPRDWHDNAMGFMQRVGHVGERPVCISLATAMVDGHKLLFVHDTSQIVDHEMIDAWLDAYMPASAFDGERLNRTDAMNFANVFRRRQPLPTLPVDVSGDRKP